MSATGPIRMGAPADSMSQRKVYPSGRYSVRCDGFKPKLSKPKPGVEQSVNMFPQLTITNHHALNGEKIFSPLNQGAGFILQAFSHMFGHDMEKVEDTVCIPGEFLPDPSAPDDISKMTYKGPLLGAVGDLELGEGTYNGKPTNYIKQYYCRLPGCKEKHPTELS